MKIGVTIDTTKNSLWSNGIGQNAIFLVNVFKELNHNVDLIGNGKINDNIQKQADLCGIKLISITSAAKAKYDVLVELGFFLNQEFRSHFKKKNKMIKIVSYQCGNVFLTDTETILFNAHESRQKLKDHDRPSPDQIWSIPQMENTNLSYYKFLLQVDKATVVPFIWDPFIFEIFSKEYKLEPYKYSELDTIAVMEPNISVFKHLLFPIIILDKHLREGNRIEKVYGIGANVIAKNERLLNILKRSDLLNKKILTAESRIETFKILKNNSQLVLSWQWENPLNYLYFDVAWMGYPIVHNAHLCKDIGYYYTGFDADEGQKMLKYAIDNHNSDKDYLDRNRNIILKYTKHNKKLLQDYEMLLNNLISDNFQKYSYDPEKNTIY